METSFTPIQALFGGSLIGIAAVALMALHGRVAGMTGILTGVILPKGDWGWRIAFLLGAVAAPVVILLLKGQSLPLQAEIPTSAIIMGGLLVGFGVTFGGGCTSGHGVCGIARLSPRSIAATLTFMVTTFVTVFAVRHVMGEF
ncbi:YeeE/YedE family protein [Devosia submarina]|uniref:YeeE/YedE family protein n=1 Tax=Devosia submarina TaxID=1173082 RepID=UPI000D37B096|nr:YeeE/YedE thiosulfate transporter family protein [Devosia submarina]